MNGQQPSWFARMLLLGLVLKVASPVWAHDVYISNENHTDYGWNATTATYDSAMLAELDYYRGQFDATDGDDARVQARYVADCWYSLYLYQQSRSSAQFDDAISRMLDGHLTVVLTPLVQLYGAMSTEGTIRAGYWPGMIERQYGVSFPLAEQMENDTIPWGLASIWAGSQARYSWKGICNCVDRAPFSNRTDEVFNWRGPDDRGVLMKWYQIQGSNSQSWGGYSEVRDNMTQPKIQAAIDRFSARAPNLSVTGLFGYGWDDVSSQTTALVSLATAWNTAHGTDKMRVSNGTDYFQAVEGLNPTLTTLKGGWGNDWDLWTTSLTKRSAQARDAMEQLRTTEALSAFVHWKDSTPWRSRQAALFTGLLGYFKFYEHGFSDGGVGLSYVVANKKVWAQAIGDAVSTATTAARSDLADLFATPASGTRVAVVNPLGFVRSDYVDLDVADGTGPYVVTDLATMTEVRAQVVTLAGNDYLRILASDVPSLGYRTYSYALGTPAAFGNAATVTSGEIASSLYRVTMGTRGRLTDVYDLTNSKQLVTTSSAMNDWEGTSGTCTPASSNSGPVSRTLSCTMVGTPDRTVAVTLIYGVDRVEIADTISENTTSTQSYLFDANLTTPQLRMEEVGAIMRPGSAAQGGDFLAGARVDWITLNHFASWATAGYTITLSNWDAGFVKVGTSSVTAFSLPATQLRVLAIGGSELAYAAITDQGGDTTFVNRFALQGSAAAYDGPAAMRFALAHQNPLQAVALPVGQTRRPFSALTQSWLSVSSPNVVVTAFKPVEEGRRGLAVRVWELTGTATDFTIDASALNADRAWSTSLIETDLVSTSVSNGAITAHADANQMVTYRFLPTIWPPPPPSGVLRGVTIP